MAQWVKNPLVVQKTQETCVRSLGQEDPLEEEMATHSYILAWRTPWTEEPSGLQSMWSQRVRHNWSDLACTHHIPSLTSDESVSRVLAGGFFTTEPPGKPRVHGSYKMNRSFEIFTKSGDNDIYSNKWILRGLSRVKKQEGCNPTLKFISRISLRLSSLTLKAPQCLPISVPN